MMLLKHIKLADVIIVGIRFITFIVSILRFVKCFISTNIRLVRSCLRGCSKY